MNLNHLSTVRHIVQTSIVPSIVPDINCARIRNGLLPPLLNYWISVSISKLKFAAALHLEQNTPCLTCQPEVKIHQRLSHITMFPCFKL